MKITFTKMHLLGNHFVVIDGIQQHFKPYAEYIRRWSNRRTGIGFDQLLLLEKPRDKQASFHYRIFNADGSEVTQCGNGALCIAQFLRKEGLSPKDTFSIATHTSLLELQIKKNILVTANLGIPLFDPEIIPFTTSVESPIYAIETPFGCFDCCVLSLGNPHCILQVKHLAQAPVEKLGAYLNQSPYLQFPQGTNVEFMKIKNPQQIELRVYERGVGETQACGSGACAAVIAGRLLNRLDSSVKVNLPGGQLIVDWQRNETAVFLTGTPTFVFKGEIDYAEKL